MNVAIRYSLLQLTHARGCHRSVMERLLQFGTASIAERQNRIYEAAVQSASPRALAAIIWGEQRGAPVL